MNTSKDKLSKKETTLYAYWSKKEKDMMFCYPTSKSDGHLLHNWFGHGIFGTKTIYSELESRGYDLTTLRFSIKKKGAYEHR